MRTGKMGVMPVFGELAVAAFMGMAAYMTVGTVRWIAAGVATWFVVRAGVAWVISMPPADRHLKP